MTIQEAKVVDFAKDCAVEHVSLTQHARTRLQNDGLNPDEWDYGTCNPEICWGLRQSLEMEHGLDHLGLFAKTYREAVKRTAELFGVPCGR